MTWIMTPNTHGPYLALLMTQTPGKWIIFYVLLMTKFVCCFLTVFALLSWVLWTLLSSGEKCPSTQIGLYLPLPRTKRPGRWIIFDVLLMTELCALLPGMFCTVIMVTMGIFPP